MERLRALSSDEKRAITALFLDVGKAKRTAVTANLPMLLLDAVAAGCFLHGSDDEDQRDAGMKLIATAFNAMDRNRTATLVDIIKSKLRGNEASVARLTGAHREIMALFPPPADNMGGDDE